LRLITSRNWVCCTTGRREQIAPLAARHALPALYSQR